MTALSRNAQRGLAIGLLVLMLLGAWYGLVSPVVSFAIEGWGEHGRSVARLAQMQHLIERREEFKAAHARLADDSGWSRLYSAESAGTATSLVQGDLQMLAQSMSIAIDSMQPLAERKNGPLSYVGARINLSAPIDVLMSLANRLGSAQRKLFIEDFIIVAPQVQSGDANPTLSAQLDVYGIWWKQP
jgi:hypothetical protein